MEGAWHWVSCLEKTPEKRKPEDLDIIFAKLKTMKAFEGYPEDVLHELSQYLLYESFLKDVTLFRPGDEGLYWYAVISGSLDILDSDPSDSSKTTSICQLQKGDSFGENVIFGANRQTMIVTTSYCELLYVEAGHIRRIYEAHKPIMERLLHLNSSEGETSQALCSQLSEEVDSGERTSGVPESELALAGITLSQLISDHFPDLFSDHRVNLYTYRQCCSGHRLVDWVLTQSSVPRTRQHVVQMWQALLAEGILKHVHKEHPFRDDPQLFYQFTDRKPRPRSDSVPAYAFKILGSISSHFLGPPSHVLMGEGEVGSRLANGRPRSSSSIASSPRSSRSSLTSILDECFDTIAQLGPEVLILAILGKEPSERSEEDIELVYEELLNVRAFWHLSNAVKRELAACVRLEHFKKAGKFLFHQGDKGDSWYIILKGSINVVIRRKGVVCTLHEGDEFGKLAVVNEGVRSASIQTREPNCYFLRVEREDFRRILLSVESTTMKLVEHGKEVLLLEKGSWGRYSVVKGTPQKMLDHLLEAGIEEEEDTFSEDFFLTYPAFMSVSDLCDGLLHRYRCQPDKNGSIEPSDDGEQDYTKKRSVAQAVSLWIRVARAELIKDATFLKLLTQLQDALSRDKLLHELKTINVSLADSIRGAGFNSPNPGLLGQLKPRKSASAQDAEIKMGISTVPPQQPQDKTPLRVHTVDHTCCRLQVRLDMTARDIVNEACGKLELDAAHYDLCEVKSSGEKVVLKDSDISVHSEMSVNGRLYVVPKDHSSRTLPPLPDQNQKSVSLFPEKDGSRDIAAHLTLYDWNLFANIQQMEFIYSVFGRHKFGKITTNLDMLIRRFNEVQFWVVTEVCKESDLIKRINLIKKFIKIAGYCKSFNNLNSFFAIVIGLTNGAVSRLRQTWKELPPKFKRRLESFEALTDPSRNHKVLRAYQSKLPPPIIPFMPLVVKDMYFLHEANDTFVEGLVNFEKMKLVASKVRVLNGFRSGVLSADVRLLANRNPSLQLYIRTLRVIDNHHVLTQMSHKIEPSSRPSSISS